MKDIKHSATATDEEIENGVMDDSGGIYSPDGKRLLQMLLFGRRPESLTSIGNGVFDGCKSLKSILVPKGNAMLDDDVADKVVEIENDVL